MVPMVASAFAHVAIAGTLLVAGAHARSSAPSTIPGITEIDVDRALEPQVEQEIQAPQSEEPAHDVQSHHHPYPVPESHDSTPHDPHLEHVASAPNVPSSPAEAAPVLASDAPSPALPKFTVTMGNDSNAHGATSNTGTGSGVTAPPVVVLDTVYREADVSSRARLVSSAAAAYPALARSGELEADVPVEIVVDTTGAVVDAHIVKNAGSGFDESALGAIRRYRFAPAMRDGHAVRVRMRWSVQFRLR